MGGARQGDHASGKQQDGPEQRGDQQGGPRRDEPSVQHEHHWQVKKRRQADRLDDHHRVGPAHMPPDLFLHAADEESDQHGKDEYARAQNGRFQGIGPVHGVGRPDEDRSCNHRQASHAAVEPECQDHGPPGGALRGHAAFSFRNAQRMQLGGSLPSLLGSA